MDQQRAVSMQQVAATFAAWKAVNDRVRALERSLLDRDPEPRDPLIETQAQLHILRIEAERLLFEAQHALLKIKTPRSANVDSTWP